MPLLETRNLSQEFPPAGAGNSPCRALSDVSLSFDAGTFVLLAGRSGSGKTVLIRHLNGLLAPTAGQVLLDGKPMRRMQARARTLIGMVFQEPEHQFVGQTVEEDVAFGPRNLGLAVEEVDARVTEALERLQLSTKRQNDPRTLSGGEKRRLAIAGVYAMRPQIIICDEPFSNLDAPSVVEVLESLILLRNAGCGVVVVTHEVEKVLAHAERLIVMEHGRIAYDGTPAGGLAGFARWGLRPPIPQRGTSAVPVRNREELSTVTWIEAPANLPEEPE